MKENQHENILSALGEFGLIRKLTEDIIPRHATTKKGIGDDAAVVDYGSVQTVITTDLMLEGIHFDLTYTPLKHLGYKSVVVNLSDIYAMNAVPQHITVSLGISAKLTPKAVEELYKGIKMACQRYNVDIIGGDTCSSLTGLIISITAIGTSGLGSLVYRSGARKGDLICVTGDLGAAYMGLLLLKVENRKFEENPAYIPRLEGYQYLLERHLKPEVHSDFGRFVKDTGIRPTSMIDLSDGLSSDLLHICGLSNVGCRIYLDKLPLHPETASLAAEMNLDPIMAGLNGGEDYELLFTIPPEDINKILDKPDITVIGHMTDEREGCIMILKDDTRLPLEPGGWNAFKSSD